MKAPVAIFAYNREEHLRKIIQALEENVGIEETDVYIFADYGDKEVEKIEAVRNYLHELEKNYKFKSLKVEYATEHKGLAQSVIDGVTKVINKYGRIIMVEDDIYTSKDFLTYMNQALDFYESGPIWSVSGYSFPMKSLEKYPHDVFYSYRAGSWGFGTWADRWNMIDWEVKSYSEFIKDKKWIRKFNRGGKDLADMLTAQMEGRRDSYGVRWCFEQCNRDMFAVYPKVSRVINLGFDGTGTHCFASTEYDTVLNQQSGDCKFEWLEIDRKIAKEFRMKYSGTLWEKIKRRLDRIFL